jgi:hypothetical protein
VPRRIRNLKSKKTPTALRHARANRQLKAERRAKLPQKTTKLEPVYWPDHIDEVKAIAMTGMSDQEIAKALGVREEQWDAWVQYYPSFAAAIEDGRTNADAEVVAALHKNAIGFKYFADEVVRTRKGAQVIQVEKHFLPETGAQKFWLQNRSSRWRAGQNINLGGQKGNPVQVDQETKMMVIHSILNLIRPQPDN